MQTETKEQSSEHHSSHTSTFSKYILVRKYILSYKLKTQILTMKGWEIQKTLTPHTITEEKRVQTKRL